MWYLVMFFRYFASLAIDKQLKLFKYTFCHKGYHCSCYDKHERCCECGRYYTELHGYNNQPTPVNISER